MQAPIKTNKLIYELNYEGIDKQYDILEVQTTQKHFQSGAYHMIDAPLLENNVLAIRFIKGKTFYVLMKKDFQNKKKLQKVLSSVKGADTITISSKNSQELKDDILLQLLLNSLASVQHPSLKFNNLTGHLYCFHPNWIERDKKGFIWKIPTVELSITPQCHLQFDVRTFSSVRLRNRITFNNKQFGDYPQYVYQASTATLHRKLPSEKIEDTFIQRQVDGKKEGKIEFFSLDSFESSKMGILEQVISKFNDKFQNMVHIDFDCISGREYTSLECGKFDAPFDKRFIKEQLGTQKIRIVDTIDNEESRKVCKNIVKILNEEFELTAIISKKIRKDYINFILIHEKEYYEKNNEPDPHQKQYDATVQHITLENFGENVKNATISTIIHEIFIKSDLKEKKIRLFNWNSLGFNEDITFICSKEIDNLPRYFFMCVHPDGTFDIGEQENTLFEENEYSQCIDIFENSKDGYSQPVKGVVKDSQGNINIIRDTGLVTIPEIFDIKEELEQGNNKLRNKDERERLFTSITDIKHFSKNGKTYYFTGEIGSGMRKTIHTATIIRQIQPYEDSKLLFGRLLPLMNVHFVKNRRLTVVPFPFKYLREYITQISM